MFPRLSFVENHTQTLSYQAIQIKLCWEAMTYATFEQGCPRPKGVMTRLGIFGRSGS